MRRTCFSANYAALLLTFAWVAHGQTNTTADLSQAYQATCPSGQFFDTSSLACSSCPTVSRIERVVCLYAQCAGTAYHAQPNTPHH